MTEKLRVGVISSVHGIHGEVKIFPTTDDINRFKKLKRVFVTTGKTERELEITGVRFFKNMVICRFAGIETPEEAQKIRGLDCMIDRSDAVPLEEGEHFIADLIGLDVITEDGKRLGICEEIFPTGANQVMQVKTETKNVLIPYIPQCILEVNEEQGFIKVHLLDGLLEL